MGFGFGSGLWIYFCIDSFTPCISISKVSKHFLLMYEEFSTEHGSLNPVVKLYPFSVWTCILESLLYGLIFPNMCLKKQTTQEKRELSKVRLIFDMWSTVKGTKELYHHRFTLFIDRVFLHGSRVLCLRASKCLWRNEKQTF